ncbi:G-D-S-L family lipolytic protein [Hydrococcus rivularis NIES-593]|uniref:G-D-S-L family lipolytic protein n=1 Tax=Hydrococcus rivularis NIES-593 TaxID=1921803 RepID=A0A1U7HD05_9CYAN|nr:GDSL-type esterase/lipase family protein [Hydrococcus rivularis]OKH21463.1 G-D-S-L family lipolytic protein [Hydrococcus rivularis NIES-593]
MLSKNKTLLLISIGLNILFIALGITFTIRRGGMSYIVRRLPFLETSSQKNSNRAKEVPRQNTYRSTYYQMRYSIFKTLPDTEGEMILLGDSLTDQGEWQELFKNANIKNRGINGETTDGIIERINEILETNPQKIFLMIGVNDFWNESKTISIVVNNYRIILSTIKKNAPETQVFVQSILPVNQAQYKIKLDNKELGAFNDRLKILAKEFSYEYIDLHSHFLDEQNQLSSRYTSDGVHLNGEGYLLWKKLIEKYI